MNDKTKPYPKVKLMPAPKSRSSKPLEPSDEIDALFRELTDACYKRAGKLYLSTVVGTLELVKQHLIEEQP